MSAYNGPTRHDKAHPRQMARPALVRTPDDDFIWADDLTRMTGRDYFRVVIGSLIVAMVVWGFLILLMVAGS